MSQSGNESERQSKKQKLLSPDPESLQGQIPDLPPNADELRKRGKLIWHWDDSDDDEFEDFPPGKVYFASKPIYPRYYFFKFCVFNSEKRIERDKGTKIIPQRKEEHHSGSTDR
ncbi:unnamed protein product [Malus baccata var. baccata]